MAGRTGLSQPDPEKRVSDVIAEARQAEDTVRKATAHFLLWLFLSLLLEPLARVTPPRSVAGSAITSNRFKKGTNMRSILLYLLGVPISFILLIALFTHHF